MDYFLSQNYKEKDGTEVTPKQFVDSVFSKDSNNPFLLSQHFSDDYGDYRDILLSLAACHYACIPSNWIIDILKREIKAQHLCDEFYESLERSEVQLKYILDLKIPDNSGKAKNPLEYKIMVLIGC